MRYLSLTVPGYGQITPPPHVPTSSTPFGANILFSGIQLLLVAAVVLSLVVIIWSGINWIMSEGDKQKLTQARNRLTYAVIGLVIAFVAFFVVQIIGTIFGVNLLQFKLL